MGEGLALTCPPLVISLASSLLTARRDDSMAEHPNATLVKQGYEAFSKGDIATLTGVFSGDVVWRQSGSSPISDEYRGRDAVLAFLGRLAQLTGGTYRIELHDLLANDEHVVALSRETGSRQGKQLDSLSVQVYHVRGGKVTEAWSSFQDERGYDEFWS
jgi:ketosteroid isomerase-like protein